MNGRFFLFAKKNSRLCKKIYPSREKNYPSVSLTDSQFENFAKRIEANINSVKVEKISDLSKGYKILTANFHSPYTCSPELQKKFDLNVAQKLLQKY